MSKVGSATTLCDLQLRLELGHKLHEFPSFRQVIETVIEKKGDTMIGVAGV